MRPVRLVMHAFGPYRGKVDLDFTNFGASSIYLISGPTGSGKTTIFDGISYALYNKASSTARDPDMLKSQFATDEDLCYVELTFEMGQTEYRVKRIPKQRAPGARGTPINQPREVEFYKENQLLDTGMDADAAIETLLGLTYDQFRQIVLLPQGEFRKLLLSSSRDKEAIFRNIFGTEAIQDFQDRLRDKAKALNKEYEEYGTRLDQSLQNIEGIEDETLATAIDQTDYEKVLDILAETIEKENNELTQNKQEMEKLNQVERQRETLIGLLEEQAALEKQKEELEELKEEIKVHQKSLRLDAQAKEVKVEADKTKDLEKEAKALNEQLEENKVSLVEVKKELEVLLEEQKASKEAELQLDDYREEIKQLEAEAVKLEEWDQKENKIKSVEKEIQTNDQEIERLEKNEHELTKEMKTLEANLAELSGWRESLETNRKYLEQTKAALEKVQQEKSTLEKLLSLQETLAGQLKESKVAKAKLDASEKEYEEAKQAYFGNLAGVLVSELTENEPCPVCGSAHHPNPATHERGAVSEEELAEIEAARNEDYTAYTNLSAEMKQTGQRMEEQKELLGETSDQEDFLEGLRLAAEQEKALQNERTALEAEIATLEKNLNQEEDWRKALQEAEQTKQQLKLDVQKEIHTKESHLKQMEEIKEAIQILKESLTFSSTEKVYEEIDKKKQQIKDIQKEAERVQFTLSKKENQETQLETSIDMINKQLAQNDEKLRHQKNVLHALLEKYAFEEEYTHYLLAEDTVEDYTQQIKAYENEMSYNKRQIEKNQQALQQYDAIQSIDVLKEELEETKQLKEALEENREKLFGEVRMHEASHREIKKNYESSKKVLKPLAIYQDLSEIANGSTKRTNRVSFERYVLSIYFQEILLAANKRFEKMTNGRFELVRREEKTKGGGADGLEVNVFDRYSGFERSVKTLSGGETFKASLSLALGLSDVIQNQQGGVRVDTLFIDEGFGTLDADSLENAIETLMELQATGRLIGIISHVGELKDRIPAKILVENKKEGSHARIEVD